MTTFLVLALISSTSHDDLIEYRDKVQAVIVEASDVVKNTKERQDLEILQRLVNEMDSNIAHENWDKARMTASKMKVPYSRSSSVAHNAARRRARKEHHERELDRAQQERFHRDEMRLRQYGY